MALLNYEFDRQLELERADAYAEGFLRGYKDGFEKEMRKQMVFNMYEEGYSVNLIADIVVELTKEEIEDAIEKRNDLMQKNISCGRKSRTCDGYICILVSDASDTQYVLYGN